jgi:trimeric autotransporter adhesin
MGAALGQTRPASRITQPINEANRVTLPGNVYFLARAPYDRGAVADSFPVQRVLLMLRRSPQQEAALHDFLVQAQTKGSPEYHKWLKPQEFGALYGPSDHDISTVKAWLEKHGLVVSRITNGKTGVEFSGTAAQFRAAFNTQIHTYEINGETHHANSTDPQIPAALAPVVAGITPVNDFFPQPEIKLLGEALYDPKTHELTPQWTINYPPPLLALAPGDFAVQYDLNPLFEAGITGTGVTIGIIGASNVDPSNFANYRSFFGLPAGTLNVIIDGLDPGPSPTRPYGNWALGESTLDVEVPGGVAPGATIDLYTAADTTVQSGLLLAAQRAIDDDQASVLSMSYSDCEQDLGTAGNQFWASLWEQAAAQGQTVFVSAGDGGAAACDNFDALQPAQYGLAVNGFASTPWNIAVGGTDFFYNSYNGTTAEQDDEIGTYWNLTSSAENPTTSLLRPVPEQPWNDPFGLDLYDSGVYHPSQPTIVAGSGGPSTIYSKPQWQSGKGVPSDHVRDVPDVSLFAADGENDSVFPVCFGFEDCNPSTGLFQVSAVGGTSVSSPAMAAIMALIDQKYGRQGQANFILYPLATQHPAVFHDVTVGSNMVPCSQSTGCTLSTADDNTNGYYTLGYYAKSGYDMASGLGSVDANLLAQYWNSLTFTPSSTSLSLSQTSFTHGTPVDVSVQVTGSGGTPSGNVGLIASESPAAANISVPELTLESGAASATLNNLPGGQYELNGRYTGDTIFAPSTSSPVTVNVAPENSTLSVSGSYWNNNSNSFQPITAGAGYPFGTYITFDAQPVGVNAPKGGTDGTPSGSVTFTDAAAAGTASSGAVNLNSQGVAEWQVSPALLVGSNSVSASYSGDASFNASTTSTPLNIAITKAASYTLLSAQPRAIAVGSSTTLSLYVGVPFAEPACLDEATCTFVFPFIAPPTGTATFSFGSTALGTAPLVPNTDASGYAWATLATSNLPLGTDTITASYSGDANYSPATATLNVPVGEVATLTASANPSSIDEVEYTQITATVTGAQGLPVPTGQLSFSSETDYEPESWGGWVPMVKGSATSPPAIGADFESTGTIAVDVSYSGDSTYGPEETKVTFTVSPGTTLPFSLSGTPVSLEPGATTGNTSTISVTPNAFTGAVYLSCALTSSPSGAQHPPTCSIPPSVTITGTSTVTAALTVNSTAPSSGMCLWRPMSPQAWGAVNASAAIAAVFLLVAFTERRSWKRLAGLLCVIVAFSTLAGCGNGTKNNNGENPPAGGTTPGAYVFAVRGSLSAGGAVQNQTTVSVTVQ